MSVSYAEFLYRKSHSASDGGIAPLWMPESLFDFQVALVEWALRRGRGAVFADCGLGKTVVQLTWAENVVRHTNGRVLVLTPLAVGAQTVQEGEKFGIACHQSRDGDLGRHQILVTNYEKLHLFAPTDFVGIVCDESSILKHFSGATQQAVTRFVSKLPYRLLCTATAAPNDYIELGTSSEALGEMGYADMLSRFFTDKERTFVRLHHKKAALKGQVIHADAHGREYRLKPHAEQPFWRWVASWARACRRPSDLGFDDARFILPELCQQDHVVTARRPRGDLLFNLPAVGLDEEREERRRTLQERVETAARLATHGESVIVWCHLNTEGDALAAAIPDSHQVKGSDSDESREEAYDAFARGRVRVLITKPKIGAWGLNWQHCAHVVTFASHSYEQYYQSVRRCWRFGQTRPVRVDIIFTEGETRVRENMLRKAQAADRMFGELVAHMRDAAAPPRSTRPSVIQVPTWLSI